MNTNSILADLRAERDRLDKAIAALEALDLTGTARRGRPATAKAAPKQRRRRRRITAAARKRMSEMMKRRWAARKRAGKATL
ncbi:MAG: hypothetical protein ABSD88_19595 [Candidatus Korobacteraceae bacterium]|jgi:hypothetical protein